MKTTSRLHYPNLRTVLNPSGKATIASPHLQQHACRRPQVSGTSRYPACLGAAILLALAWPVGLPANDVLWRGQDPGNNDFNGFFGTDTNWIGDQAPGDDDFAIFSLDETFTVSFGEDRETARFFVLDGVSTFDLGGNTYSVTGPSPNFNTPVVRIGDGPGTTAAATLVNGTLEANREDTDTHAIIGRDGAHGIFTVGSGGVFSIAEGHLMLGSGGTEGRGELIVKDGGRVPLTDSVTVQPFRDGGTRPTATITVTGVDSEFVMGARRNVSGSGGSDTTFNINVLDGGLFEANNRNDIRLNQTSLTSSTILISGDGARFLAGNNNDIDGDPAMILGNNDPSTPAASHRVMVMDGGRFEVTRSNLLLNQSALLHVSVSNNNMVALPNHREQAFINDGRIHVFAAPTLAAGAATFNPITINNGEMTGDGDLIALGGVWDDDDLTFEVSERLSAGSGDITPLDLAATQRLQVTGGGENLVLAFDPNAQAEGGGSTIDFTASVNSTSFIGPWEVLAAWDFETDLADGFSTWLSMDVGSGVDVDLFVWHSPDGNNWSRFDTDVFRENEWAGFLVDGFSSYALTIPEPSTALLISCAAILGLATRRRRGV